jgi:hypothetical protein
MAGSGKIDGKATSIVLFYIGVNFVSLKRTQIAKGMKDEG